MISNEDRIITYTKQRGLTPEIKVVAGENYDHLTVGELRGLAKSAGHKVTVRMRKPALLELLNRPDSKTVVLSQSKLTPRQQRRIRKADSRARGPHER